jgi:hypothetical protein
LARRFLRKYGGFVSYQRHDLTDYYLQGNFFYNNYIPPLLPDHIPEFITNVTTGVVKTIAYDMSLWTPEQLNESAMVHPAPYTKTYNKP